MITTSTVCTKQFTSFQIMQILTPVNNVITQQATNASFPSVKKLIFGVCTKQCKKLGIAK